MDYRAPLFESRECAELSAIPVGRIDSFHWEQPHFSRPETMFCLYAVKSSGICARLWSFEDNVRTECSKRDDPVYTDSCLEFFIMPVPGDERYMNFEVNSKGVYLSEIGERRGNRQLISEITALEPEITPFTVNENGKTAWGCEIFLPDKFISAVYGKDYSTDEAIIKGNFYKCADLSASPHFGAYFPVSSEALGFHNPGRFGSIIIRKA